MKIRVSVLRKLVRDEIRESMAVGGGNVMFGGEGKPQNEADDDEQNEAGPQAPDEMVEGLINNWHVVYEQVGAKKWKSPFASDFIELMADVIVHDIKSEATIKAVKKATNYLLEVAGLNPDEQEEMHELMRTPEYKSIESFIDFKMSDMENPDEAPSFSHVDAAALATRLRAPITQVIDTLKDYGLVMKKREPEKRVRGFTTSSNDRWYGPGSLPTHGGAGIDTSSGRATVRGKTI